MSWVGAAVAVGTAVYGASQNKKAAKAANQGEQAAIDEQRRQYDLTRQDRMPWMDAGRGALAQMQAYNNGDFSKFYETPDYKFAMDQGLQSLERGASSRGGMYSGGADADRMKYASGLASQNYGAQYSRLSDLATGGNATAGSLGTLGMQMGQNIGQNYSNMGANRASAYGNNYNMMAGAGQQVGGALSQWYGQNNAANGGNGGWYLGNNPGRG